MTLQPTDLGSTKLERAARILREAILRGDLRPGEKLKQQEVAQWLDMSATPVREVLRMLVSEGLLVYTPNKGVFVAEISIEDTAQIAPIRAVLERLAVEMSVPQLTDDEIDLLDELATRFANALEKLDLVEVRRINYEFHSSIYGASGSPILVNMIEKLWPRFATEMQWMIPGRSEVSTAQHRAIVAAIRRRDAILAGQLMAEHIQSAGNTVVEFLRRQSHPAALEGPPGKPQLTLHTGGGIVVS